MTIPFCNPFACPAAGCAPVTCQGLGLASNDALVQSRIRLVETADRERTRIAQDLHDGIQVQLVLLALAALIILPGPFIGAGDGWFFGIGFLWLIALVLAGALAFRAVKGTTSLSK